jgi:hypothetical protein
MGSLAGATYNGSATITVPNGSSGNYFLIVVANGLEKKYLIDFLCLRWRGPLYLTHSY